VYSVTQAPLPEKPSQESGTKCDPACVEALERVIGREQDQAARAAAA
jgi:hypothetical protein